MAGEGNHFVKWGRYFKVDSRLLVAITGAETSFGTNRAFKESSWAPYNETSEKLVYVS